MGEPPEEETEEEAKPPSSSSSEREEWCSALAKFKMFLLVIVKHLITSKRKTHFCMAERSNLGLPLPLLPLFEA